MEIKTSVTYLQQLVSRIRNLGGPVLSSPVARVPDALTAALFEFYIEAKSLRCLDDAAETARSLAGLLHHCGERTPNELEWTQISVLLTNVFRSLEPEALQSLPEAVDPLVTPITPSKATANRRIALYIDSAALMILLTEALTHAGFQPESLDSLEALTLCDESTRPVAIIADLSLCEMNPLAPAVFSSLRRHFASPPHLFCVATSSDIPARLQSVRFGATRFVSQPIDTVRLIAVLKGVTAIAPAAPFRVAVVEDDPFFAELYGAGLSAAGIEVCPILDPMEAPRQIAEFMPDVIVSDLFMPKCNGFELLALLRQDDSLTDTPIMLLSSERDVALHLEGLSLGADDFLTKPVDMSWLIATVSARAKRSRVLKRSRSEYRSVLKRVRELEAKLAESTRGEALVTVVEIDHEYTETINMDDFVPGDILDGDGVVWGNTKDTERVPGQDK